MHYPSLSLIRPSVRRRLRVLAGGDPARPRLDRGRVEAALHRQMRVLGIDRPIAWQGGLGAAREAVIARALASLPERIPEIARAAARRLARARGLCVHVPEPGAEQRDFVVAAKAAAWRAAYDAMERQIAAAVHDPRYAERTSHPWNARWGERAARGRARGAVADLYLACRQPRNLRAAIRGGNDAAREPVLDAPAPPSFAEDWMSAWMIAWAEILENPEAIDDPYGEAGQAAWDALLERAGGEAGREVLTAARSCAFAAFVENALDPVYGAWCALGELNAGSPGGDLARPWSGILRSFWLPFLQMSTAGLALYWATPEAIICLPRPALFFRGGARESDEELAVVWPDGERSERHEHPPLEAAQPSEVGTRAGTAVGSSA
ncbi:MAG TPA: hypothetical protein VMA86_07960 [Acetobacteraceae bacterium]|nr:hypothetical protein [Acetobacteraceae bacterium]